jgi:hypothetical protein
MNKLEVTNPFDHSHVGEVPVTDWDAVDAMLEHASKAFLERNERLTAARRMEILQGAAAIAAGACWNWYKMQVSKPIAVPMSIASASLPRSFIT